MHHQQPGAYLSPPPLHQQPQSIIMSPPAAAAQHQLPQFMLGPPSFLGGPPQIFSLGFPGAGGGGLFPLPGFLTMPRLPLTGPPPAGFCMPQQQLLPPGSLLPEGYALLPGYGPGLAVSQPPSPVTSSSSSFSSVAGTPPSAATSLKRKASIPPSPEQSPQGPYIGQHSQGLGGHYADSYWHTKRQKRS